MCLNIIFNIIYIIRIFDKLAGLLGWLVFRGFGAVSGLSGLIDG